MKGEITVCNFFLLNVHFPLCRGIFIMGVSLIGDPIRAQIIGSQ